MARYKVGDHVRIVSEWNNECCQNPEGLMDHWLGAIMTIKSWNGLSYQMEEDGRRIRRELRLELVPCGYCRVGCRCGKQRRAIERD